MTVFRSRVFTPLGDPFASEDDSHYGYYEDGYLSIVDGRINGVGEWSAHPESDEEVINLGGSKLIVPGFVDTHLHAPQL